MKARLSAPLALGLILWACTGSSEVSLGYRLVVAATEVGACAASTSVNPPGLAVLPVARLNDALTAGATPDCAELVAVRTDVPPYSDGAPDPASNVPYELVNNAQGTQLFASFPRAGKVMALEPSLSPDGPPLAGDAALGLCPTRIELSPNATQLAVLDDPADPVAGCDPTPSDARSARVLLYRLAEPGRPPIVLQPPQNFQAARAAGPLAVGLTNENLFVLSPFAGVYQLYRFDANATRETLESAAPNPVVSDVPGLSPSIGPTSLDLTAAGDRVLIAFVAASGGGTVLPILTPGGATVTVGTAVQADGAALAPTRETVLDPLLGTVAALTTTGTVLLRDTRSARAASSAQDLTFTPDGFAWALSDSALTRIDQQLFPGQLDPRPLFGLGFRGGRSVGWVLDPTIPPPGVGTMRR